MTETEWVTIAEAARRLGLAERQARRWADRLPADARRQEETAPGRSRALIRLDLLSSLVSGQVSGQVSGHMTGHMTGQAAEPKPDPEPENFPVPLALAMTAQRDALERVMQEKERVISEQAARICDLQAALDHERGQAKELNAQARQLAESLAREQTLRMLERPAEQPPAESPESPQNRPSAAGGAGRSGEPGPKPPQGPILAQIAAFWKRHWY